MIRKTRTFIGSSSEGLVVAKAIEAELADLTEAVLWTEGVFLPGRTFVETLEKLLDEVDYAILVATPDDVLLKRDVEHFSMRDNVLLEMGLFMAKLGRRRTYLVMPKDTPLHIPTDLLGVQTVTYASTKTVELSESLQEPCRSIRRAMAEAEKDLSAAMRRVLIKRILMWTMKVHEFITFTQTESLKSILDRAQFERMRVEVVKRAAQMLEEHRADADRLSMGEQYQELGTVLNQAVETLPFPEEAAVSRDEVIGGVLSHVFGRTSVEDQLRRRVESLLARYENWWSRQGAQITRTLGRLQAALVDQL